MNPEATMHRLIVDLQASAAVDPDLFREMCVELEVWEEESPDELLDECFDLFEDAGMSAARRFTDLSILLWEPDMAEFMVSEEGGGVRIPHGLFEAAAVVPLDGETGDLDRPALRRETMRRIAEGA